LPLLLPSILLLPAKQNKTTENGRKSEKTRHNKQARTQKLKKLNKKEA